AFYALGAYGAAILGTQHDVPPGVILVLMPILGFVVGLVLAPPLVRTRGLHFAVATLAIGIIASDILDNWVSVTRGPLGIGGVRRPGPISLLGVELDITTQHGYFGFVVVMLGLSLVIATLYHRSRVARVLVASRDDELLATSIGFGVVRYRIFAFALTSAVGSFAGVLYAWYILYVSPPPFSFFASSFEVFVFVAVGGAGTIWGPAIGAIGLTVLPELLDVEPYDKRIVYGAILLGVTLFLSRGVAPTIADLPHKLRDLVGRRSNQPGEGAAAPDRRTEAVGR
ncbi:MAG TPA: branched-chain amino acid ABC transporter permease, partial [Acidimicrobiales bacterium]|nr:branched-chain amino acid ABC transporter permease [Acidimicrobiales bacterium]